MRDEWQKRFLKMQSRHHKEIRSLMCSLKESHAAFVKEGTPWRSAHMSPSGKLKMRTWKSRASICRAIDEAIQHASSETVIWVSYNGHQKPWIPRAIRPTKWERKNESF